MILHTYGAVVDLVWKGSVILALSLVASALLRRRNAAGAHLVLILGLASMLLFPLFLAVAPSIQFPKAAPSLTTLPPITSSAPPYRSASAPNRTPGASRSGGESVSEGPSPSNEPSALVFIGDALTRLWLVGVGLFLVRLLAGAFTLRLIRSRRTEPFPLAALSTGIRDRLKGTMLLICLSDEVQTAMTWGVFNPVILLPRVAVEWSESRLSAVLSHELAHVRRRDYLCQMIAELTSAIYWPSPLVWIASYALRISAELSADAEVLATGIKPSEYAVELLQLAHSLPLRPRLSSIGVPTMMQPKIKSRIQSILSPRAQRRGFTSHQTVAATLLAAVAVTALAGLGKPGSNRKSDDRALALVRGKALGLATIMYATDYDDVMPYAQGTVTAASVIRPYARAKDFYKSPAPGGQFLYNLNVGGVMLSAVESPATVPTWHEKIPNLDTPFVVVYMDGHVKMRSPADRRDLERVLRMKFPRDPRSKPLPLKYLSSLEALEQSFSTGIKTTPARRGKS